MVRMARNTIIASHHKNTNPHTANADLGSSAGLARLPLAWSGITTKPADPYC